jgi:hypothetical protein
MGRAEILQYPQQLETTECISCGVTFAFPKTLIDKQRRDGGYHYCPNGHQQGWSQELSENGKLKAELEAKNREIALQGSHLKHKDDQIAAQKGINTKLRKRIGAGVCPCCHRTFQQLAGHMATKHPDYKDSDD